MIPEKTTFLAHLNQSQRGRIVEIKGGFNFQRKMCTMGLREGSILRVVSKQPFMGPITIAVGNCHMTIGRGMAQKIVVEEL
ncbi:MAG: ferrous iron transport protein A [Candidatus Thermoplasmatota archaeon]|nr:ferrous iron transport protein A [Candidatus Thermoplasmatota archaeon]